MRVYIKKQYPMIILVGVLLICCIVVLFINHRRHVVDRSENWAIRPMVCYDGALYCTTTYFLPVSPGDWPIVGVVESACDHSQVPTKNNQTNHEKIGYKICIDPNSPNYIMLLCDDGSYAIYQKEGAF